MTRPAELNCNGTALLLGDSIKHDATKQHHHDRYRGRHALQCSTCITFQMLCPSDHHAKRAMTFVQEHQAEKSCKSLLVAAIVPPVIVWQCLNRPIWSQSSSGDANRCLTLAEVKLSVLHTSAHVTKPSQRHSQAKQHLIPPAGWTTYDLALQAPVLLIRRPQGQHLTHPSMSHHHQLAHSTCSSC